MPNKNILKHHEALKSRKTQSLLPRLIAGWQKDDDGEWFRGVLVASTDTEEVLDLYEKDILAADLAKTIAEQAKQIAALVEALEGYVEWSNDFGDTLPDEIHIEGHKERALAALNAAKEKTDE